MTLYFPDHEPDYEMAISGHSVRPPSWQALRGMATEGLEALVVSTIDPLNVFVLDQNEF